MSTESLALLTDLYQLTMLKGYFDRGMNETAVFEFFVRRLPKQRNFLVAAGLEQALAFLENFKFSEEDLRWLADNQNFPESFLNFLRQLRFNGDVEALPEGTVFFAHEPVIRITAPLPIAQYVETHLINILQFQIMVASKAAQCVLAAPGKALVEFGLRRAHGETAGLMASRASYVAGFAGTSNVLAGKKFGIPLSGTMAHSFIQAHVSEEKAFEDFAISNPNNVTFLIDTYDTVEAARKVVKLAPKLQARGIKIKAVRLDSGDLGALAESVRQVLEEGGLKEVKILASGNVNEEVLRELIAANAPIDGFGIGTRLVTCSDAPYLECAYKLMEYEGRHVRKYSEGKITWPGRKQVFRNFGPDEKMLGDTLGLETEKCAGTPLLVPCIRAGKRVLPAGNLNEFRDRALKQYESLPRELRDATPTSYPLEISPGVQSLAASVDAARKAILVGQS